MRDACETIPLRHTQILLRMEPSRHTPSNPDQRLETVGELLADARSQLVRLSPDEAREEAEAGAIMVDLRPENQRRETGAIPGAAVVPRNVLEWRLDPASPHRDSRLAVRDRLVILICEEGYQSSLAASTLRRFGVQATDVIGGAKAWRASGLPLASGDPVS